MKRAKRVMSVVLACMMTVGIVQPNALAAGNAARGDFLQYGDAKAIGEEVYELTALDTWQSGGLWIDERIKTQKGFTVSFSYCAGGGRDYSFGGADGLILAFSQKIGLGADGEYMGFVSGEAYGVEFDSYPGNPNDPKGKHIAIIQGKSSNHLAYVLDDRVDDDEWHDVEIDYADQRLEVCLDGKSVLSCADIDLPDEVYLGLSAATGNGRNRHLVSGFQYEYAEDENNTEQPGSGEFRFSSNVSASCIARGSTFDMYVGLYRNNTLYRKADTYRISLSDSNVIELNTSDWNSAYGRRYTLTAKKAGSVVLTATEPTTGSTGSITLTVVDSEAVCSFDRVPAMEIEKGKTTNFYNYSGMVVDDFQYRTIKTAAGTVDHYAVTMTVYNTLDLYGAVTAYDAGGNIHDYCVIEKHTSMDSSFVDSVGSLIQSTGDLFYLIGNQKYYSGKSIATETKVEIDVPVGGYLEISNNPDSPVALFANVTGITVDFMATIGSVASSAGDLIGARSLIVEQGLADAFTKDYAGEKAVKAIRALAKKELKNGNWNLSNFGDGMQSFLNALTRSGINLLEIIAEKTTSVTGIASITESVVLDIVPTGSLIRFFYALSDAGGLVIEATTLNKSVNYPIGIYLYVPVFSDVSTKAYYSDAVQWARIHDIAVGTGASIFQPEASCTRAQAVTFLWRAAGNPEPKQMRMTFSDVPAEQYYFKAVQWAVEIGITSGTSAATFHPDAVCSRAQIVTFLHRSAGSPHVNGASFVDVSDSSYYASAVQWAVAQSITSGASSIAFQPDASCTRAQIVAFLYRAYAKSATFLV